MGTKVSDPVKEGIFPLGGILLITGVLVAVFALFIFLGKDLPPVVPPHMDDGESVDPSPARLAFMCMAFVLSFVFARAASRQGTRGKLLLSFFLGYTGGTLLWQSVGECAWHFSIVGDGFLMCFPHLEGASSLILVILTTILLIYCRKRDAFDWGVWVFVLSFVGNWFGHFVLIGTYPLVSPVLEEKSWYYLLGIAAGTVVCATALWLNFRRAESTRQRLLCCLMLYFGIGLIVTGTTGI